MFCIPGAGASVTAFIAFANALGSATTVYGLQPRGVDEAQVPHTSVVAAASAYIKAIKKVQPAGPYQLVGHSFGGWVACELVAQLIASGEKISPLIFLDLRAPIAALRSLGAIDHTAALVKFASVLRQSANTFPSVEELQRRSEDERLQWLMQEMKKAGLVPSQSSHLSIRGAFRTFMTNKLLAVVNA